MTILTLASCEGGGGGGGTDNSNRDRENAYV